jgi:hypothetical protein
MEGLSESEARRWSLQDQAIAYLQDAHWTLFHTEPRYGNKYGVEGRKHKTWRFGLMLLSHAANHIRQAQ